LSRKPTAAQASDAKRPGRLRRFDQALQVWLRESGLGPSLAEARALRAWNEACGESLARCARPVRLRGGELLVQVASSTHLHELRAFTGESLRRAANERLPDAPIERVVFELKR